MTTPVTTAAPSAGAVEVEISFSAGHLFDATDLLAIALDARQRTCGAALMLIAHATIEFHIEQSCRRTADRITATAPSSVAFLAWGMFEGNARGPSLNEFDKQRKARGSLTRLREIYEEAVEANNGVKQRNLERLLIPLGVDLKALSAALSTLESFGNRRGELAHNPPALAASLQSSPSAILSEVLAAAKAADEVVTVVDGLSPTSAFRTKRRFDTLRRMLGV